MKTAFVLLGHGSRASEANQALLQVAEKVSHRLGHEVTPAYMAHCAPNLPEAVMQKIEEGAERIIIMPLFLFRGVHVTVDIHEELKEIQARFPDREIVFTRELGADDAIALLATRRIEEAMGA